MTVDNELFNEIIGELDVVASVTARSRAIDIIRRIRRTETERCAGLLRKRGEERNLIGTSYIADELLRTSPGKGGG